MQKGVGGGGLKRVQRMGVYVDCRCDAGCVETKSVLTNNDAHVDKRHAKRRAATKASPHVCWVWEAMKRVQD
jgi:hypothetical protein